MTVHERLAGEQRDADDERAHAGHGGDRSEVEAISVIGVTTAATSPMTRLPPPLTSDGASVCTASDTTADEARALVSA